MKSWNLLPEDVNCGFSSALIHNRAWTNHWSSLPWPLFLATSVFYVSEFMKFFGTNENITPRVLNLLLSYLLFFHSLKDFFLVCIHIEWQIRKVFMNLIILADCEVVIISPCFDILFKWRIIIHLHSSGWQLVFNINTNTYL